jgi:hypothetical protein
MLASVILSEAKDLLDFSRSFVAALLRTTAALS